MRVGAADAVGLETVEASAVSSLGLAALTRTAGGASLAGRLLWGGWWRTRRVVEGGPWSLTPCSNSCACGGPGGPSCRRTARGVWDQGPPIPGRCSRDVGWPAPDAPPAAGQRWRRSPASWGSGFVRGRGRAWRLAALALGGRAGGVGARFVRGRGRALRLGALALGARAYCAATHLAARGSV